MSFSFTLKKNGVFSFKLRCQLNIYNNLVPSVSLHVCMYDNVCLYVWF